jgi:hypothetical protein
MPEMGRAKGSDSLDGTAAERRRSDLIRTSVLVRPGTFSHIRPQSGPISVGQSRAGIRKSARREEKKAFVRKSAQIFVNG